MIPACIIRLFSNTTRKSVRVIFVGNASGKQVVEANEGDNLMRVAQKNGINIEGACEGSLACSTCHVYIEPKVYSRLQPASEEEEDMLDMAVFVKDNSRLSCQIDLSADDMDGMTVELPPGTRNLYVDGHVPKPH
ncbi:hypothetical protein ACOME3_006395 [Neoechinorhynchus agilis]